MTMLKCAGATSNSPLNNTFLYVSKVIATGGDAKLGGDDFTDSASNALMAAIPKADSALISR